MTSLCAIFSVPVLDENNVRRYRTLPATVGTVQLLMMATTSYAVSTRRTFLLSFVVSCEVLAQGSRTGGRVCHQLRFTDAFITLRRETPTNSIIPLWDAPVPYRSSSSISQLSLSIFVSTQERIMKTLELWKSMSLFRSPALLRYSRITVNQPVLLTTYIAKSFP